MNKKIDKNNNKIILTRDEYKTYLVEKTKKEMEFKKYLIKELGFWFMILVLSGILIATSILLLMA